MNAGRLPRLGLIWVSAAIVRQADDAIVRIRRSPWAAELLAWAAESEVSSMNRQISFTGGSPESWGACFPALDYWLDACQRSILTLDVLRQRGNIAAEHNARLAPNVLSFTPELVLDGRTLARPVNYALVRIVPPQGIHIDPAKRPFIIVDPRAGHGPGIGGMKHDSEIGVALEAGHPCYFVGFLPNPFPGQTVEDVCRAEAIFVEDGHRTPSGGRRQACRHRQLPGGLADDDDGGAAAGTCRADHARGRAACPIGPGVHGKNPMRYLGGVLGGTWLTALTGDLGNGIFDGADLIANFE